MKKTIYFDNAATTPLSKEVLEKMLPYLTENFGNANSQHSIGRNAVKGVDDARDSIAKIINCKPNELYFTSGGTESDNWAIKGIMSANRSKGKHLLITPIEHHALLESAKSLEKQGYEVEYIKIDNNGFVDLEALKRQIRQDTVLVSVMMANNEIGTIEPIKEIAKIVHNKGALFFSDAVQSLGVLDIDVLDLGVDLMSFSSHKIYGPKGVGALYIKSGIKIDELIIGGHQERTKRGGTTNVASVVGFSEALKLATKDREKNALYVTSLRDRFIKGIEENIEGAILNGSKENRLPANANFTFSNVDGDALLYALDLKGICVSAGSACSSGSLEPSHVLLALGMDKKRAKSSIRFSFGKNNTIEEVDFAINCVKETYNELLAKTLFNGKSTIKNV